MQLLIADAMSHKLQHISRSCSAGILLVTWAEWGAVRCTDNCCSELLLWHWALLHVAPGHCLLHSLLVHRAAAAIPAHEVRLAALSLAWPEIAGLWLSFASHVIKVHSSSSKKASHSSMQLVKLFWHASQLAM